MLPTRVLVEVGKHCIYIYRHNIVNIYYSYWTAVVKLTHVASAVGGLQGGQRSFCDGLLGVSPAAVAVHDAVALEAPTAAPIQTAGCHPLCLLLIRIPHCRSSV